MLYCITSVLKIAQNFSGCFYAHGAGIHLWNRWLLPQLHSISSKNHLSQFLIQFPRGWSSSGAGCPERLCRLHPSFEGCKSCTAWSDPTTALWWAGASTLLQVHSSMQDTTTISWVSVQQLICFYFNITLEFISSWKPLSISWNSTMASKIYSLQT